MRIFVVVNYLDGGGGGGGGFKIEQLLLCISICIMVEKHLNISC